MSVLDRLQFYLMHFMPYPDVVPGRPQGQWVYFRQRNASAQLVEEIWPEAHSCRSTQRRRPRDVAIDQCAMEAPENLVEVSATVAPLPSFGQDETKRLTMGCVEPPV